MEVNIGSGHTSNLTRLGQPLTSPGTPSPWVSKPSPWTTYQAILSGTGTLSAVLVIEVSNDGPDGSADQAQTAAQFTAVATVMATITLSDTIPSDGFTTQGAPWKYVRARLTSISGTNAAVRVIQGS